MNGRRRITSLATFSAESGSPNRLWYLVEVVVLESRPVIFPPSRLTANKLFRDYERLTPHTTPYLKNRSNSPHNGRKGTNFLRMSRTSKQIIGEQYTVYDTVQDNHNMEQARKNYHQVAPQPKNPARRPYRSLALSLRPQYHASHSMANKGN